VTTPTHSPADALSDADERDIEAVIAASRGVRHGTNFFGGSFRECVCPKAPCGGVAAGTEREDCPEHARVPAQLWYWAAQCPGNL
jgi:hypothetical protein